MTAYLVVYQHITDASRFDHYVQTVLPVIARRGGRLLAANSPEVLEGVLYSDRAVIFEWPSRRDVLDFWHSDEYAQIKTLRQGAADWQAAIISASAE